MEEFYVLGLDMGTTTVSAAVTELGSGRTAETVTAPNPAELTPRGEGFHEQDAGEALRTVKALCDTLTEKYPVAAIGLTGQMHGIVYLDGAGRPVSPLATWQDQRGMECFAEIREKTGKEVPPGYGLGTLAYDRKHGLVPPEAESVGTIMDAASCMLTGRRRPLLHASNGASMGLYDPEMGDFDRAGAEKCGIDPDLLPSVTEENAIAGYYHGIPVAAAIGDNQSSVFGTLREEEHSVLVNYGTGSQISVVTASDTAVPAGLEKRPYLNGKYLLAGSGLCGGRAYAMTERFFRVWGGETEAQYDRMNRLAEESFRAGRRMKADTRFCGTRQEPSVRGGFSGIGEDNFDPGAMILGVLYGMAEELEVLYHPLASPERTILAASGNAVQKNPVFPQVLREVFRMEVRVSRQKEEAAFDAGLFGALATGRSLEEVKSCIGESVI